MQTLFSSNASFYYKNYIVKVKDIPTDTDVQELSERISSCVENMKSGDSAIESMSTIIINNDETELVCITECNVASLSKRAKSMHDHFSSIKNFNCNYSVEKLNRIELRNELQKCLDQNWSVLLRPKSLIKAE